MDDYLVLFLSFILLAAAVIDFRSRKIPNLLTFPAALGAVACYSFLSGMDGFLFSMAGLALGIGLLIIPYLLGGMGAGDAKLMGVVGSFLGAKGVFGAFLLSAICGGFYALGLVLFKHKQFQGFFKQQFTTLLTLLLVKKYIPDPVDKTRPKLCYGIAIAFGTLIYIGLEYKYGFEF